MKKKIFKSVRRKNRTSGKINRGRTGRKISVFRSNRFIWAQVVDLTQGKTLVSFSSKSLRKEEKYKNKKLDRCQEAFAVGKALAKMSLKKGIKRVVFDRGPYAYHGRVKQLAQGAREGGLKF